MKPLLPLILALTLSGCATMQKAVRYLPNSPVRISSGDINILYGTLRVGGYVEVGNPFAKPSGDKVMPVEKPVEKPPVVVPTPLITTLPYGGQGWLTNMYPIFHSPMLPSITVTNYPWLIETKGTP